MTVAVVGAGWAGLAAAVRLADQGHDVSLFEVARQPGGRARDVTLDGHALDNGQHICIGAYDAVRSLGRMVGLAEAEMFHRMPLELIQRDREGVRMALHAPRPSAPFGRGLRFHEVPALLHGLYRLRHAPSPDTTVGEFLDAAGQPPRLRELLWHPLCIATLNTPPERASAQVFAEVIRRSFTFDRHDSELLLPVAGLGRILPVPALAWLERNGADIRMGARVLELVTGGAGRVTGLRTGNGTHEADAVVLAVPPDAAARLLEAHLPELARDCRAFEYQPIATVYLDYGPSVRLDPPLQGITGMTVQWLVDRRTSGSAGVLAAVISAEGPHTALSTDALARRVADEIASCFPDWPEPVTTRVVREKHATFAALRGINALRPETRTALPGLWLAGDWTRTGLPATLEGAVRSGFDCARCIHEEGDANA